MSDYVLSDISRRSAKSLIIHHHHFGENFETATDPVVGNYYVPSTPMTWSEGMEYCYNQYGTALATITNEDDAQTLLDLFEQNGGHWIGLYDYTGDNTGWEWASGYPWFVTVHILCTYTVEHQMPH